MSNIKRTTYIDENHTNELMKELNKFRYPNIKKRFIAYRPYGKIKDAIDKGEIYIARDDETDEIIGYLWMENLKRKPLSRIREIGSSRRGLGRELMEMAFKVRTNKTLQLHVVDFNDHAIGFYQHMQFVEIGRDEGKTINNITMEYRPKEKDPYFNDELFPRND